ncbi:MAG: T9SS type A sorting domain-containing protein, partial [Hymenobacteraceae bacterium]|nr:T9SS type A sorting domain-containing protein [Hymenobacteraceae bacterium]
MKKFILTLFTCFTVLFVQAQVRPPVVGQATQTDKVQTEALDAGDIAIYPNPSNGVFTISLSGPDINNAEIRIINVIGNEILHETLTRSDGQFSKTVNLTGFAKGLYYVKLEADNYSAVR